MYKFNRPLLDRTFIGAVDVNRNIKLSKTPMNWQFDKGAENIYNIVAYPDGVSAITFRDVDSSLMSANLINLSRVKNGGFSVIVPKFFFLLGLHKMRENLRPLMKLLKTPQFSLYQTQWTVIRANREDIICHE